jgi:putative ABC transport system permease protein
MSEIKTNVLDFPTALISHILQLGNYWVIFTWHMFCRMKRIGEILFFRTSREIHMLLSILKSAARNIVKRKFNTILSVIGLTVGYSSFILISMFIKYELSWDNFHDSYDRIYRIQTYKTVEDERLMQTSPALSRYLDNKFSDIHKHGIVLPYQKEFLSIALDNEHIEKEGQYADQNYLDIFSFHFIHGDKSGALVDPLSIILSSKVAKTLFQDDNPVGKTIVLQKKHNLKVTGVYEDLPKNSHLRPDFIISFSTLETIWNRKDIFEQWDWNAYFTYVMLNDNADYKNLDASIKDILKDKIESDYRQLYLRPLSKLNLFSTSDNYLIIIYLLGFLSIFVLILASINYINLSVASSSLRGKEIGIKKVIGSSRAALIAQVFLESFLVILVSFGASLIIIELVLDLFNQTTDKSLTFSILFRDGLMIILFLIIIISGILSSIYPALLITSIKSIDLFKKRFIPVGKSKISLKKSLVVFQFTISIILITITILMTKQIRYIHSMDIGFEKSDLLFTKIIPSGKGVTLNRVKNKLRSNPQILSVSASQGFPINSSRYTNIDMTNWEGGQADEVIEVISFWISYDFVSTVGLEIKAGRGFSQEHPADTIHSCIINETAAKRFGWDDPVGKYINDRKLQVIGVIKDMHFHDMYNPIKPLVLLLKDDNTKLSGAVYFAFRIGPGSEKSTMGTIKSVLKDNFPFDPFQIKIFNDFYKTDMIFEILRTINSLFFFFALIAIVLSVLGVIGLITHSLQQRTKEIAIRKVSGCSTLAMFKSITFEYILLIAIASIAGSIGARYIFSFLPIYYPAKQNVIDFLIAVIIILIVTFVSIGHKTWKESSRNPIDALRYE